MKSISSANHPAIRVQSILRHCDLAAITRSLEYVDNAARNARAQGTVSQVEVVYGQCSGEPALDAETLGQFRRACPNLTRIDCTFFGDFLAYAEAHNRLLAKNDSDYTLIMDPEALAFPDLFGELLVALAEPGVGLAEARQIPIEHPKDYDQLTGETSWASSVCAMAPTRVFDKVSGFDSESFSFCLADVDFSWRVRMAGYKVVHQRAATVFHDRRLTHAGGRVSTDTAKFGLAEARLLLTYKYSRPDLTERYLDECRNSGSQPLVRAAAAIDIRKAQGRMPMQVDLDHVVGQFIGEDFAVHRFAST